MMPQTDLGERPKSWRPVSLFVRIASIALLGTLAVAAPASPQAPAGSTADQTERVAASFVLARGRMPSPAEAEAWKTAAPSGMADLLARHGQELARDAAEQQRVAVSAARDAFGLAPSALPPGAAPPDARGTYLELVRQQVAWLQAHPDVYAQSVGRAYRLVLHRDPYPQELAYWARRPAVSFAMIAACVHDWARRNQPGLTVTAGPPSVNVNSPYLTTVRLSPALAAETRAAAGFSRPRGASAARGWHVIAPGADEVASVGGIHFAAAGTDALALVGAEALTSSTAFDQE